MCRMVYCVVALVCPVKQDKIVFSAFEGNGYGCNPKYIAEEIIRRDRKCRKKHELVWLVNDTDKAFPAEIKKVKNNIWNRAYHLSTAKVWVDNARKNLGTRKRKGQYYVQTWHGPIGVKPEGRRRGKSFSKIARIVTYNDARLIDCFLVNSKLAEWDFSGAFYGEPLKRTGSPRCDVLINERLEKRKAIREKLGLPKDSKLVMYAPTFRGGSQNKVRRVYENPITLDFSVLKETLESRFGGEWFILLRLHPQLALRGNNFTVTKEQRDYCIDISKADDMYEYMSAVDAFVSDYSSGMADAAVMRIPVFTYADDLDEYEGDRGKFLYDIHRLPFPVARTNEELKQDINDFDIDQYQRKLDEFFERIELREDGKASDRVADMIEKWMEE